jgi:hypothetical protein
LNTKLNCSICAKCYRAIITLIILGKDPRKYGFEIEITTNSVELFYDNLAIFIQKNVFNQSVYFYWLEILDEMNKNNNSPFIFFNEAIEIKKINELNDLLQKLKFKKKTWKTSIKENLNSYRKKWFQTINKLNQK